MSLKISTAAAALAALIGISQLANADVKNIILVENLVPAQRQEAYNKLSRLTEGLDINWDKIALGVDQDGNLVLLDKSDAKLQLISAPSSFGIEN